MSENTKGVIWDLTSFFPEFNGREMLDFKSRLQADIEGLQKRAAVLSPLTEENALQWEKIILDAEDIGARLRHISSYVGCLFSVDAANEEYALEKGRLTKLGAEFEKVYVDIKQAFKGISQGAFDSFISREPLRGAEHKLRKTREIAEHSMSPSEEKLATDLNVDGLHSWGRLYDTLTGKLEFDMEYPDGRKERKPISQWRALMANPDREIGRAAFEGGNKAWQSIENVCASALNAISGNRLTLYRYRGINDFLDMPLVNASISRKTLDAMYEAIHANIEIAREVFRVKARYLGRDSIWWYEREAPMPLDDAGNFTWERTTGMVGSGFGAVYPELAKYYQSVLDKKWIESEARPGKRPGAFCTGSIVTREQRVYMTFNGTLGDVTTIAHEVGHAFHNHVMRDQRPMAMDVPMTLAETASIFAEHILSEGCYRDKSISDDQKFMMLDKELGGAAVLLLDITVRFEFEKAIHEERRKGEISVSRLKELMVETQRRILGDCMADGGEDPYFWASKLHFYLTGQAFYNFPYTFGFLVARALYEMFKEEGASLLPKYEEFLRLSGSDTVENVARRSLGVDINSPDFWIESIHSLERPLKLYKGLLQSRQ